MPDKAGAVSLKVLNQAESERERFTLTMVVLVLGLRNFGFKPGLVLDRLGRVGHPHSVSHCSFLSNDITSIYCMLALPATSCACFWVGLVFFFSFLKQPSEVGSPILHRAELKTVA